MSIENNHKFTTSILLPISTNISNIWADTLDLYGRAWWVEISTARPKCTYYFGPYANRTEANLSIDGYIADLESEFAQDIRSQVKRCKPKKLTIEHD
jgi:hypothetical protein